MKNCVLKLSFLCVIIMFTFASCSSLVSWNSSMDPNIQRNDHAVVSFDKNLKVVLNGDLIYGISMLDSIVPLSPGEYRINLRYDSTTAGSNTITTTMSGWEKISYNFESGHYYTLTPKINRNKVTFEITDITELDSELVATMEKRLNSYKFPKELAFGFYYPRLLEEARNSTPTKFEGRWENNKEWIEFIGNYYIRYRKDHDYYNDTFKVIQSDPNWPINDTYESGIFEFDDNSITLTIFSTMNMYEKFDDWFNHENAKRKFTYSLSSDTINFTSSNKTMSNIVNRPVGIFKKKITL